MLLRLLFATFLLAQVVGMASVVTYEPIPQCFPCPEAR